LCLSFNDEIEGISSFSLSDDQIFRFKFLFFNGIC